MKIIRKYGLAATLAAALSTLPLSGVLAQQPVREEAGATAVPEDSWYGATPPPRVEKPSLAKEKAMHRGQQRMARLDAMRWYGFSGSRPTAATMPFTTMYSPAWQMPGGRPFAWYTSTRPILIYTQPEVMYR